VGRFFFTLAVAVWLGTLVSFSYVFLPSIHAWSTDGSGRDLVRRLFPRYHLLGIICGLVALATIAVAPRGPGLGGVDRVLLAAPVAVALLCAMIGRQVLLPRLAALGDDVTGFERTHRLAAMLNTTALAMLILALAAASSLSDMRLDPAPRPTVVERR
jgi:hypothetical protein